MTTEHPAPHRRIVALSARTPIALAAARSRLAGHLSAGATASLADVATTLATGREPFAHRWATVGGDLTGVASSLVGETTPTQLAVVFGHADPDRPPHTVFAFPDSCDPYPGMALRARALFPNVRHWLSHADEVLAASLRAPLPDLLAAGVDGDPAALAPVVVAIEYALARQLEAWGVVADAYRGHGMGELAASALAGALGLDEALLLAAAVGRPSVDRAQAEAALVIDMDADSLAAQRDVQNGPALVDIGSPGRVAVVGGRGALADLVGWLTATGVGHRAVLGSALPLLAEADAHAEEHGAYALQTTASWEERRRRVVVVEIGHRPGFFALTQRPEADTIVVTTLAPDMDDETALLAATAAAWCHGAQADLTCGRPGRRIHLPGYAFEGRTQAVVAGDAREAGIAARPLTPREQRLIFHDLVRAGSSSAEHNVWAAARVEGGLVLAALAKAFEVLQSNHPALRTVFQRTGPRWLAVERPAPLVRLEVHRIDAEAEARRLLSDAAAEGFPPTDSPRLRGLAAVAADGTAVVALIAHLAVADRAQLTELLNELASGYASRTSGPLARFKPLEPAPATPPSTPRAGAPTPAGRATTY